MLVDDAAPLAQVSAGSICAPLEHQFAVAVPLRQQVGKAAPIALFVDRDEASKVLRMLQIKFPGLSQPLPMLSPENTKIFRVTPTVISVLDYSKGFGHTDLVTC